MARLLLLVLAAVASVATAVSLARVDARRAGERVLVHEWGTYTSCQGPDGVEQPGLHHGEADLPSFVAPRVSPAYVDALRRERGTVRSVLGDAASAADVERVALHGDMAKRGILPTPMASLDTPIGCGLCEVLDFTPAAHTPSEVTQKLETPVLYFYRDDAGADDELHLNVTVRFPHGIVTEAYPRAARVEPAVGAATGARDGVAEWAVRVANVDGAAALAAAERVPDVDERSIWAPSRHVRASYVTATTTTTGDDNNNERRDESEHHVFYRGLGRFDGPLLVSSSANDDSMTVSLRRVADVPVASLPAVFVLASDGAGRGAFKALGSLRPSESVCVALHSDHTGMPTFSPRHASLPMANYLARASVELETALVAAGLFPLEARAMVDTWSKSYFRARGVRVLYVAPRGTAERMLPLDVRAGAATPSVHVDVGARVLVGRVESLLASAADELRTRMLALLRVPVENDAERAAIVRLVRPALLTPLGRFAEPKIRAALAADVAADATLRAQLERFVVDHLTYESDSNEQY